MTKTGSPAAVMSPTPIADLPDDVLLSENAGRQLPQRRQLRVIADAIRQLKATASLLLIGGIPRAWKTAAASSSVAAISPSRLPKSIR
jgi:hypothetical protein